MCFKESRRLFYFLCECYVLGHYRRYNYNCSSIFDTYFNRKFTSDCPVPHLWNHPFDHVVVSVSIDFPSYSQQDAPFHGIAYDYSCADWDGLCDHVRGVPWEDTFRFSASAVASEFFEWVHVGIDVYIPH